jgi:hypothetical protein
MLRVVEDVHQPGSADGQEPDQRDRPEHDADAARAETLDGKKRREDDQRDRHDIGRRNAGVTTSMPSTADKTEIAGVMTASP